MLATRFADLSFQARLTLVAATAVAVTVVAAAVGTYFVAQNVVYSEVNNSLQQRAEGTQISRGGVRTINIVPPPDPNEPAGYVQAVLADGNTILQEGETVRLPVNQRDRQVAAGDAPPYFHDALVNGRPVRIYTAPFPPLDGVALQVARPLTEANSILNRLAFYLIGVALGGIALATVLGRLIAQAALLPIYRLRAAADRVAETRDVTQRVPDEGEDELGRLGAHFNRMLDALDQSLRAQRQLVADASHELRTPLASLRTNVEVLQRSPDLVGPDRERLLRDLVSQVEQLTRLIQDLIDLARGDQAPEEKDEVRLDWVVAAAVERAAVNWPALRFEADLGECVVLGQANRLERAISNLLDNAGKWSPPGGVVEVRIVDHELTVRDHGPGIAVSDLPYVFDRFWRAPGARGMPGSGLGLSIVRQVADAHGATVTAELPPDGGTLMRFRFSSAGGNGAVLHGQPGRALSAARGGIPLPPASPS